MSVTHLFANRKDVSTAITYAINPEKTIINSKCDKENSVPIRLVTGINCDPNRASIEFRKLLEYYSKRKGVKLYHFVQSFDPDEVTPELCHLIGIKLVSKLWAKEYQVVIATHVDKLRVHNHIDICGVSMLTGRALGNEKIYKKAALENDNLCREYGLRVSEVPKKGIRNPIYFDLICTGKNDYSPMIGFRRLADISIKCSSNVEEFYKLMDGFGYSFVSYRDQPAVIRPGWPKPLTTKTIGESYSPKSIEQRILQNTEKQVLKFSNQSNSKVVFEGTNKYPRDMNVKEKYACFVKALETIEKMPDENINMYFLLRDEQLRSSSYKFENELIQQKEIINNGDINLIRTQIKKEIDDLSGKRKDIQNNQWNARKRKDYSKEHEFRDKSNSISVDISRLRRQVIALNSIEKRIPIINELLNRIYYEKFKGKDVIENERDIRRSRSGYENSIGWNRESTEYNWKINKYSGEDDIWRSKNSR